MQGLGLNFVETVMKTGRKRTVIHTVHYIFELGFYKELVWTHADNIKQD